MESCGFLASRERVWLAVLGQASGETESVAERVEEVCEGKDEEVDNRPAVAFPVGIFYA